jgi:hypothetical protein
MEDEVEKMATLSSFVLVQHKAEAFAKTYTVYIGFFFCSPIVSGLMIGLI